MSDGDITIITAADIERHDNMVAMIDALQGAFAELHRGAAQMPPRTWMYTTQDEPRHQMLSSPASLDACGIASVKVTTLTPSNRERGLPLAHGVVILINLATGRPMALLDGVAVTALRTGGVAGLATRLVSRADASDLAVIGAGVQARALVRAMLAVRPIRSIRLHSRTPANAEVFADWIRQLGGRTIDVRVCEDARSAVLDADIVCTATSTHSATPLIEKAWIAPGAHVNVIGGATEDACEIEPSALADAFVLVEQRDAAMAEAGEVRVAIRAAALQPQDLIELGEVVSVASPPLPATGQTTVFRCVGIALEDLAAAQAVYDAVRSAGGGSKVSFGM